MKSILVMILAAGLQITSTAQQEDLENVVQLALDLNEIQGFYHPEMPGRMPIMILDNDIVPNTLRLEKFGVPVEFWDKSTLFTLGMTFFLQFEEVKLKSNSATLQYQLFGEGIYVNLKLKKENDRWIIVSKQVVEK